MNYAVKADIGVVGMAVMGSNLARNLARNGYRTAIYNRTAAKTDAVFSAYSDEGTFIPSHTVEDFVASIQRPRSVILMVQAGPATDATIKTLLPHLEAGDIIMDGGNSFFEDTRRREAELKETGIHFVGTGISGGELGALEGPSIMPGGSAESYQVLGPMLEKISAQVDGEPCCAWMGPDGAGHFVKMVHNGIEYSDMQVIGEAYELLKAAGLSNDQCSKIFNDWNEGDLDSYLIEITANILRQKDPRDSGRSLIDMIVDQAGMKGTGTWTVQTALDNAVPVNSIAEAVFARAESSHTDLRKASTGVLQGPDRKIVVDDLDLFVEDVRGALWCSKVVSYAQGLDLIRTGGLTYGWNVDIAEVAKIWRDGCIIRAKLLEKIRSEYAADPELVNLMLAPSIAPELAKLQDSWRQVVGLAVESGVPAPTFSASLAYYDMARAPRVNAALTQGMRDYFGSHTYRRIDDEGSWHTDWTGDQQEREA